MEDRRFDALVKSLASGASRRSLLKGALGLGGAALGGGVLQERGADAARRPTPTPKPVSCPGAQTWNGTQCKCPTGLSECGPDCCNPTGIPDTPNYSECCDNACCYGHCYGEELCCEYPLVFCAAQNECCGPSDNQCCGSMGCCDHACCPAPGGGSACCEGDTPKCCPDDSCIPEDGCCTDADCGGGCQSCIGHVCTDDRSNCPNGVDGCYDCVSDVCQKNTAYCSDGDDCTSDLCSDEGFCSNPFSCTSDSCCDDGDACTNNVCDTGSGVCSNPFYCTSDGCCDSDHKCKDGACVPKCVGDGSGCDSDDDCCEGSCWDLPTGGVCFVCLPDFTPCAAIPVPGACDHCCNYAMGVICSPIEVCWPESTPCLFPESLCCSGSCSWGTCD